MIDAGGERIGPRAGGDPARIAEGWERRFIAEGRRAQEMADLYARLGYEVCVDPLGPGDLAEECADCALVELLHFRVVYTRRLPPEETAGD
ncbi:MAG: hypothetical protein ACWGON_11990 [Gemmatimonadota bacterium]